MTSDPNSRIGRGDFERDEHACKYLGEVDRNPEAFDQLFELINDCTNERLLENAAEQGLPAFQGIVKIVEADHIILRVLRGGEAAHRFRQAVGVAIKLKMERLGWQGTGESRALNGTCFFTNSKLYVR